MGDGTIYNGRPCPDGPVSTNGPFVCEGEPARFPAMIFLVAEYFGRTMKGMADATHLSSAAASNARQRGELLLRDNAGWVKLIN